MLIFRITFWVAAVIVSGIAATIGTIGIAYVQFAYFGIGFCPMGCSTSQLIDGQNRSIVTFILFMVAALACSFFIYRRAKR